MAAIAKVLDGMIDMHCHSGPSPFPRRFLHYEAAQDAHERLNMRAIVVKSHHHNTVMDVLAQAPLLESIPTKVFGGIALNSTSGGVSPHPLRMSLNMGGKVVWWPTISSGRHIECHPEDGAFPTATVEITVERIDVIDDRGELTASASECMDLIKEAGVVLNAGHMYPEYVTRVFQEAKARGLKRLVLSHPNFVIGAEPQTCDEMVELGAFIEHEAGMYDPEGFALFPPETLMEWIGRHGPEHVVLASDLGQRNQPAPVDAFLRVGAALLDLGLPETDLQQMTIKNQMFLLGMSE